VHRGNYITGLRNKNYPKGGVLKNQPTRSAACNRFLWGDCARLAGWTKGSPPTLG
jgi:hypothetical protein